MEAKGFKFIGTEHLGREKTEELADAAREWIESLQPFNTIGAPLNVQLKGLTFHFRIDEVDIAVVAGVDGWYPIVGDPDESEPR